MRFKRPFYVSEHAVRRFRERVADLPTRTIRTIIQAALQDSRQPVMVQVFNHRPCPVYRARYRDIDYLIPVQEDRSGKKGNVWPVVPTILLAEDGLGTIVVGKRQGWKW